MSASGLKRLTGLYRKLPEEDRSLLIDFALLLAARRGVGRTQAAEPPPVPSPIARPEGESVIAAIRRLSQTYPMLDRGAMLNDTSALMSAHVLQGQGAVPTIDALETLFARHYEEFRARLPGKDERIDDSE